MKSIYGIIITILGLFTTARIVELVAKLLGQEVEPTYGSLLMVLFFCFAVIAACVYGVMNRKKDIERFKRLNKGIYEVLSLAITEDGEQQGRLRIDMSGDSLQFISDTGAVTAYNAGQIKKIAFPYSLYRRDFRLETINGKVVVFSAEKNMNMQTRRELIAATAPAIGDVSILVDYIINGKDISSLADYFKDYNDNAFMAIKCIAPDKVRMSPNTRIGLILVFMLPLMFLFIGLGVTLFDS